MAKRSTFCSDADTAAGCRRAPAATEIESAFLRRVTLLTLYTNSSIRRDFLFGMLDRLKDEPPGDIWIASAFLTWTAAVEELAKRGWRFRVLAGLRFPTAPRALRVLRALPQVQLRYVTSETYHPKLYVVFGRGVVIGSSNLTDPGFHGNQEANIEVPASEDVYAEALSVFSGWWQEGRPLDEEVITAYENHFQRMQRRHDEMLGAEREFEKKHGTVEIKNIDRGRKEKKRKAEIYVEEYRRRYQSFTNSFDILRGIYVAHGQRRYSEQELPLRLEIDGYLAWLRDKHAKGESYKTAPLRHGDALAAHIRPTVAEFTAGAKYKWGDDVVVPTSYPTITRVLGTPAAIAAATWDDVIAALGAVHSFHDRLRFFDGGHETHVAVFKEKNSFEQVKATLTYLLHGPGDSVERMAHCLFDPAYRLREFGASGVPETFGWVNREEKPVRNARTTRSMKWLGLPVELLDD